MVPGIEQECMLRRTISEVVEAGLKKFGDRESLDGTQQPNRRVVLRGLTTAGVAFTTLGVSGVVAGKNSETDGVSKDRQKEVEKYKKVEEPYQSLPASVGTIEKYARDVTEILAEEGVLGSPAISSLPITKFIDHKEFAKGEEGILVSSLVSEGVLTALLSISVDTPEYRVNIYVQPQLERSYAILEHYESNEKGMVDPSNDFSTLEVGTQSTECKNLDSTKCDGICPHFFPYVYKKECCRYGEDDTWYCHWDNTGYCCMKHG